MWENYSDKVNEFYNKLDKLKPNNVENKVIVKLGGNKYTRSKKEDSISLAEKMSNTLQTTYGFNKK